MNGEEREGEGEGGEVGRREGEGREGGQEDIDGERRCVDDKRRVEGRG